MSLRVLLADDHRMFRDVLRSALEKLPTVNEVIEVGDGRAALDAIVTSPPDLAILDLSMPELTGLEVLERAQGHATPCLILTMHRDPATARRLLDAGARAVVLKDDAFTDLEFAIDAALRGGTFVSPKLTAALSGSAPGQLTPRERAVLTAIADGAANKQIAHDLGISIKTVETHRARLMKKLGVGSTAELIRSAVRAGLVEA